MIVQLHPLMITKQFQWG